MGNIKLVMQYKRSLLTFLALLHDCYLETWITCTDTASRPGSFAEGASIKRVASLRPDVRARNNSSRDANQKKHIDLFL